MTQQEIFQNMTKGEWRFEGSKLRSKSNILIATNLTKNDAEGILLMKRETIDKGINPESVEKIYENLARIIDRIEENNLQDQFPSAYTRAKESLTAAKLDNNG
jgi:hypothetical protein